MRSPKLSIIIPVYNVERYIKHCLDSIKSQTMNDFEIIIVNDGATDNSETIIKEYQKNNPELIIKYFKKENGGLASARNYGVKYAEGDYISFIDPDDYLDNNTYEDLKIYMDEKIDVIKFKLKLVNTKNEIMELVSGPVFSKCSGEEAYKILCVSDKFMDPACIYLYRRKYFVENNFQYKLRYHEDFGLTSLVIVNAKTFVSTNCYGYNYLQTDNSLTRDNDYNKNKLRAKDMIAHYDHMIENIEKYNIEKETKEFVKRYYTNSVILKTQTLNEQDQKEYIKEIKQRKMYKNIKANNIKQLIKRILLAIDVKLYLKMR